MASYRLGMAYEKNNDSETALLVSNMISIPILFLRLSARLFVLLGLIGGVMSHLDFQYISIVAWSYICVYRPVFPVWRRKTLKSAW